MSTEQQENITRVFDGPIGVPDLGLLARLVAYEDGNFGVQVRVAANPRVDWGVMTDETAGPDSRYATMAEAKAFFLLLRRMPEVKEAMGLTKDHGIHAFVDNLGTHNSNFALASLRVFSVGTVNGKCVKASAVIDKDTGFDVDTNQ